MSYVYAVATWLLLDALWAYDGATWRDIQEAWVYDGATWRKVFEAVSCLTASIDTGQNAWTESGCTDSNECQYCIAISWANCTDPCHNIDGKLSTNGGSYLGVLSCGNKACANKTGTDCGVAASWEFSCNLASGGTKCLANTNNYRGRLEIQRDSDLVVEATYTGTLRTGACLAI